MLCVVQQFWPPFASCQLPFYLNCNRGLQMKLLRQADLEGMAANQTDQFDDFILLEKQLFSSLHH